MNNSGQRGLFTSRGCQIAALRSQRHIIKERSSDARRRRMKLNVITSEHSERGDLILLPRYWHEIA